MFVTTGGPKAAQEGSTDAPLLHEPGLRPLRRGAAARGGAPVARRQRPAAARIPAAALIRSEGKKLIRSEGKKPIII